MLREKREMDSGVQPRSVGDELEHGAVSAGGNGRISGDR